MINYEHNLYHKIAYQYNVMLYMYYRYRLMSMTHYKHTQETIIRFTDDAVKEANTLAAHLNKEDVEELRSEVAWDFAKMNLEDFHKIYSWRFQQLLKIQKHWLAINCSL